MSLSKNIFKHTAIYSFASILGKSIGFIMLPFYTYLLGSEGYGIIGMLDIGLGVLALILGAGLRDALIRFYSEETEDRERKAVISSGIILIWIAGLLLLFCLIGFSKPISLLLLGKTSYSLFVKLALIGFVLSMCGTTASTILLIEQKSVLFSGVGLLRLSLGLSLNIYLIVILRMGLLGYFISSVSVSVLSAFIFNFIAFKRCGFRFDIGKAKKLIIFELPLVFGNLFSFVSRQAERVLFRFMISLESVGILEVAYKFPVLLAIFFTHPFMQSWAPKRIEIADQENAPAKIAAMFTHFLFVMTLLGTFMAVNIKDIIHIITPKEFWVAYTIALVEIASIMLRDSYQHFFFGLFYAKDTKKLSLIKAVTSGIKIPISYLLIKIWGLGGAAYSALLGNLINCIWVHRESKRYYDIPFEWKKISLISLTGIVTCIVVYRLGMADTVFVAAARDSFIQPIQLFLHVTGLGAMKNGIIIKIINSRLSNVIALFLNSLLCFPLLCIIPAIYPEFTSKLIHKLPFVGIKK